MLCLSIVCIATALLHAQVNWSNPNQSFGAEKGSYYDAGLRHAVGTHVYQITRTSKDQPADADSIYHGEGFTMYVWEPSDSDLPGLDGTTASYRHNVLVSYINDLWYCVYRASERHEDAHGTALFFSTSEDGIHWDNHGCISPMQDQEFDWTNSWREWPYQIFSGPNSDRVLIRYIAGDQHGHWTNATTMWLVFMELNADGTTGEPHYYAKPLTGSGASTYNFPDYPYYDQMDQELVDAIDWFMQYADVRTVLGSEENSLFDGPKPAALDKDHTQHYFRWWSRSDGNINGVNQMGATMTEDSGETWTSLSGSALPTNPAKMFVGWTGNDRCAWVGSFGGNPRFPAFLALSDDGVNFDTLLSPVMTMPHKKYWGSSKTAGFNYMSGPYEGLSEQPPDGDFWYSFDYNKEEAWMGRIEVPIQHTLSDPVWENFEDHPHGAFVSRWNIHRPVWCPTDITSGPVDAANNVLRIRDRDPWDRAIAERAFPESSQASVEFKINPSQANTGYQAPAKDEWQHPDLNADNWGIYSLGSWLAIELQSWDHARPVRLYLATDGKLKAVDGQDTTDVMDYNAEQWYTIKIEADCGAGTYTLYVDDQQQLANADFAESAATVERLTFRSGKFNWEGQSLEASHLGYLACSACGDATEVNQPSTLQEWYVDDVNLMEADPTAATVKGAQKRTLSLHDARVFTNQQGVTVHLPGSDAFSAMLCNANGTVLDRVNAAHTGMCTLGAQRGLGAGVYYITVSRSGASITRRIVVQ
jgi:hypothetical protein